MLRFHQYLTEATDQKTALARLKELYKQHRAHRAGFIDAEGVFAHPVEFPPSQGWNDTVTYREKVGGVKIQQIPVDKLIPTQLGMSLSGIERFIKQNPNRWNDTYEVVRVVKSHGKYYVMDGHHRASAAILMGYPTVPGELQPISEAFHPEWVGDKGDCFRNANKWNARYGEKSDYVAHGTVTNVEGKRFAHAWIERGNTVIDPTTGVSFPKAQYYKMLQVTDVTRYSSTDAIRAQIKSGHHGPWN